MKTTDYDKKLYFGKNGTLILGNYVIDYPCNASHNNLHMLINQIYTASKSPDFIATEYARNLTPYVVRFLNGTVRVLNPNEEIHSLKQTLLFSISNPSEKIPFKYFLIDCLANYHEELFKTGQTELSTEQFISCLPALSWVADFDDDTLLEISYHFLKERKNIERAYGLDFICTQN